MRKSRDAHLERNARKAAEHFIYIGHLFFAEDYQVVQIPLVRLSVEDFVRPVSIAMRSHFLTATAAGKGGLLISYPVTANLGKTRNARIRFFGSPLDNLGEQVHAYP